MSEQRMIPCAPWCEGGGCGGGGCWSGGEKAVRASNKYKDERGRPQYVEIRIGLAREVDYPLPGAGPDDTVGLHIAVGLAGWDAEPSGSFTLGQARRLRDLLTAQIGLAEADKRRLADQGVVRTGASS